MEHLTKKDRHHAEHLVRQATDIFLITRDKQVTYGFAQGSKNNLSKLIANAMIEDKGIVGIIYDAVQYYLLMEE